MKKHSDSSWQPHFLCNLTHLSEWCLKSYFHIMSTSAESDIIHQLVLTASLVLCLLGKDDKWTSTLCVIVVLLFWCNWQFPLCITREGTLLLICSIKLLDNEEDINHVPVNLKLVAASGYCKVLWYSKCRSMTRETMQTALGLGDSHTV